MDKMHNMTDRKLKALEHRLQTEYKQAYNEMSDKLSKYLKSFEEQDMHKRVLLSNGKITDKEYTAWRRNQILTGKRWRAMQESLAAKMTQTNKESLEMVNATIGGVFADNANFGAYEVESGFSLATDFTLYNENTARSLVKEAGLYKKVNVPKDLRWNSQKISSAVLQGVLQGESINKIAKRMQSVTDMNEASAVRNARTMITGAENAGRLQGYQDLDERGLHVKKVWESTISNRTRESHRALDLESVPIDETFGNGLMYPGDPDGEPAEVYNCRCTMICETDHLDIGAAQRWSRLPDDITYDEWKEGK